MENRKIQYTKQAIFDALIELLKKKPVEKISVTELCKIADINRTSFYKYYLDIYDLMEKTQNEFYDKIHQAAIQKCQLSDDMKGLPSQLRQGALKIMKKNHEFCQILLADHNNLFFNRLIKDSVSFLDTQYTSLIAEKSLRAEKTTAFQSRMLYQYIVNGSVSIARYWVENGCQESIEEVDHILCEVNRKVVELLWVD